MNSKTAWLVASVLMVVALVLSSCGPAAVEEGEKEIVKGKVVEKEAPVEEKKGEEKEAVTPAEGEPVYGGSVTVCSGATQVLGFDPALVGPSLNWVFHPCGDTLVGGDWWKGPAGTNEWLWDFEFGPPEEYLRGDLLESWERVDPVTAIYHVRKGVFWQDRPGVMAPREFTADDVVFNLRRLVTSPKSQLYNSPGFPKPEDINALDKYTVKLVCPRVDYEFPVGGSAQQYRMVPSEVIEKYGDMQDWEHVVGTGAYILTDYVSGSTVTYEKNPAYFMKDPEGRSLPYLDGFQVLIIPDASTRMSALRTGKIATLINISWSDAEGLRMTNPELESHSKLLYYAMKLTPKCDELPFSDRRVRRALSIAIDRYAIAEEFYKGNAKVVTSMVPPIFEDAGARVEELPPSQKELFDYSPEKAKQLLAEAGYPDGFKTKIHCYEPWPDLVSVIKSYWDAVGVETEIEVHEVAAQYAKAYGHEITDVMLMGYSHGLDPSFSAYIMSDTGGYYTVNWGLVNDPFVDELYEKVRLTLDADERYQLQKELTLHIVDQAWDILVPTQTVYNFWQPWLKGYHGESSPGWYSHLEYLNYVWVDQKLREEMGH